MSYSKLNSLEKFKILKRITIRKKNYLSFLHGNVSSENKILIVGDRPGPSAPKDPSYHHTPFYSVKHCSGWLNKLLQENLIEEEKLIWINAYDQFGTASNINVKSFNTIVALGGNAEKWLKAQQVDRQIIKTYHPQFWKRFKSGNDYPLINILKSVAG